MNRPELSPELKEKYFALYYGQKVAMLYDNAEDGPFTVGNKRGSIRTQSYYLALRRASNLTKGELIRLSTYIKIDPENAVEIGRNAALWVVHSMGKPFNNQSAFHAVFYELTKMGVAVPFAGYQVNELIEAKYLLFKDTNHAD